MVILKILPSVDYNQWLKRSKKKLFCTNFTPMSPDNLLDNANNPWRGVKFFSPPPKVPLEAIKH